MAIELPASGAVRVTDFMTPRRAQARVVRIIEGLRGVVPMRSELLLRFDYGLAVPWLREVPQERLLAINPGTVDETDAGISGLTWQPVVDDATLFAVTVEKPGGVVVSKRDRIVVTAARS